METCRSCKWWGQGDDSLCVGNQRPCGCPKIGEDAYGDDEMSYDYDEGGGMNTGPDYGCVHHETKEPADE